MPHEVLCTECGWAGKRRIVNSQRCPNCLNKRVQLRGRSSKMLDCLSCRGNGGHFGFSGGSVGEGRRTKVCKHCYGTGVKDGPHGMPYCDSCSKPSETVTAVGYGFVLCPDCLAKEGKVHDNQT